MLSLLLLHRGITIDLGQSQMSPRLTGEFVLVLQNNSAVSTNLNPITTSWARRHIVSLILFHRPICLTSIVCKIGEKTVLDRMTRF